MSTATADATELVNAFFTAFGAGDVDALVELFDEGGQAQVQGSPRVPWTGTWSGRDEVRRFFAVCLETVVPQRFEVAGVRPVLDGSALVTGTFEHLVPATGRTFESDFALVVEVRGDLIARYLMFENSWAVDLAFEAASG